MTGIRKTNGHLPTRLYIHHGTYWHVPKEKGAKWVRIARVGDITMDEAAQRVSDALYFNADKHSTELFRVMRRSAITRKIELSLTLQDIRNMLKAANYRCTVTGIPFSNARIPGVRVRPWIPSVDRIENSKGYTVENCRIVCAYVNIALNAFGMDTFNKMVRDARRHYKTATILDRPRDP